MAFRIVALPIESFHYLFAAGDDELRAHGARRVVADTKPGYPCRVSLMDAEPGESLFLLPFTHHDVESPYRASGPIYVRERARTATPAPDEVPLMLRTRLLSLRAYDDQAMLLGAEVLEGRDLETQIARFFADESVRYLHVHNARPGCYNCRIDRA